MLQRKTLSLFDKCKITTVRLNRKIRRIVKGEQTEGLRELVARLRTLPEFQDAKDEYIVNQLDEINLQKCRDLVAIEHGYKNWRALSTAMAGSERGALNNEQRNYTDSTSVICGLTPGIPIMKRPKII